MLLGFKSELKLNNKQPMLLAKNAGVARHDWKWGLALCKGNLDNNKTNPNSRIKFSHGKSRQWSVASS